MLTIVTVVIEGHHCDQCCLIKAAGGEGSERALALKPRVFSAAMCLQLFLLFISLAEALPKCWQCTALNACLGSLQSWQGLLHLRLLPKRMHRKRHLPHQMQAPV